MNEVSDSQIRKILDTGDSISSRIDKLLDIGLEKSQIMKLHVFAESTVRQRIKKRLKEGKTIGKGNPPLAKFKARDQ